EALQRQALGTIDDRRRQVFVPQAGDPLRELAAERRHQRAASPGIVNFCRSSSPTSALDWAEVSATSGGRTVAQLASRPWCAIAALSAGIIGDFWKIPRITSGRVCFGLGSACLPVSEVW